MDVDTFNLSQKLKTHVIRKYINPEWNKDLTLSISDLDLPIKLVCRLLTFLHRLTSTIV
ncbi:hypothetical protein HYC85_003084 [Camellia sinensis]|uniref:C2 domain-containing protein n=1 Tax=Camellia sinensis TaxID=4442 RepID=A0A7J7IAE5_CAMSI|nr:hypothetical protein HYC85_003084 [Camellia sinensis]